MPDTRRADYRPPKVLDDDLDSRLRADKAWHDAQDAELARLLALPEAKTTLGYWRCGRCNREMSNADFCMTCGDLVCPDEQGYDDWRRPQR